MRRIADKRYDAVQAAREKEIHAAMRRLEYRALAKCAHGHPSDDRQWVEFQRRYNSECRLHTTQLCRKCAEDTHERERKEIYRVAEIACMERQIAELQTKITALHRVLRPRVMSGGRHVKN